MSIEFYHELVVLEQTAAVGHREQRYLQLLGLQVQLCLHIHAHCGGTFIQNCEQRTVVKQSCHRDSLLLTSGKHVVPIIHSIETFLSLLNVVEFDPFQQLSDLIIASGDHVFRMGVDNLVSECTGREIGSLRNVEQPIHVGAFKHSTCQGPKPTQNSKK